jgi:hypothetical protein
MEEPKKKQRRTPEQLAADYQRKANAARAKAAKAAKEKQLRLKLELGQAALDAGLSTPDQVAAAAKNLGGSLTAVDQVMLDLFKAMFGPKGTVVVGGTKAHWEALTALTRMTSEQRDILFAHWQAKGWPMAAPAA